MESAADLLDRLPDSNLTRLTPPSEITVPVTTLSVIESLDEVRACAPGALVIVSRNLSESLTGFELDTMVRYAADAGIAGFIFHNLSKVPITVQRLATQTGITIFGFSGTGSLVDLVHRLDGLMGAGHASALDRARGALEIVRSMRSAEDHAGLVQAAGVRLGSSLTVEWLSPAPADAEPIVISGLTCGWISSTNTADPATSIVLPAIAAAVAQVHERAMAAQEQLGAQTARLFEAGEAAPEPLAERLRARGLRVDSLHLVACLMSRHDTRDGGHGPLVGHRQHSVAAQLAAAAVTRSTGRSWLVTRIDDAVGLVWSDVPSGSQSTQTALADLRAIVALINKGFLGAQMFGGLGLTGSGVDGLITAAAQARLSAFHAMSSGAADHVAQMGVSPLDELLLPSLASPYSMSVVRNLLRPLADLSPAAQLSMVQTLAVYLDHHGSNARAAQQLHLHPNAVGYRIKKAVALLGVDLTDPDLRTALHLASRLWLMERREELQRVDQLADR